MTETAVRQVGAASPRTSRVGWTVMLAAVLVLAAMLFAPRPAAAHGGDIDVELGTDGEGGISVALLYVNDGHPVEESAEVVVTAQSADGQEVGPVTLSSAAEGVGWYVSDSGLLEPGNWTLDAEVSGAGEGTSTATATVDVLEPVEPEPLETDESAEENGDAAAVEDSAEDADTSAADGVTGSDAEASGSSDGSTAIGWIVGALAVVAVVVGALIFRARRARS